MLWGWIAVLRDEVVDFDPLTLSISRVVKTRQAIVMNRAWHKAIVRLWSKKEIRWNSKLTGRRVGVRVSLTSDGRVWWRKSWRMGFVVRALVSGLRLPIDWLLLITLRWRRVLPLLLLLLRLLLLGRVRVATAVLG